MTYFIGQKGKEGNIKLIGLLLTLTVFVTIYFFNRNSFVEFEFHVFDGSNLTVTEFEPNIESMASILHHCNIEYRIINSRIYVKKYVMVNDDLLLTICDQYCLKFSCEPWRTSPSN